ncbi:MAG: bestrophin family ion channel [Bacteroidota bacterium]
MKAYNPKAWTKLIFHFHKSDSFRMLLPAIVALAIYSAVLCYVEVELKLIHLRSTTVLHSLLGFVLSLLLVFRTNTAYDRWWEGRKLWGDLVNNSRNLMFKINAFLPDGEKETKQHFSILIGNFAMALKEHLRHGIKPDLIDEHPNLSKQTLAASTHAPNKIIQQLFIETNKLHEQGIINAEKLLVLNGELSSFANVVGACERIKSTPIPYSYSTFIKRVILIYTITLPLGLVDDFKWATIPMVLFVFYAFAGLELIAEEIEDPFGKEDNDLPTDDIAERIKKNLVDILK